MKLKDIIDGILCCDGGIVNIVRDSYAINDDFIHLIEDELKDKYNIIHYNDELSLEKINSSEGKNLIVIDYHLVDIPKSDFLSRQKWLMSFFRQYTKIQNQNILLLLSHANTITNTQLNATSYDSEMYASSIVMLLKNKKITVLKSRYLPILGKSSIDINTFLRKSKIKNLNKINP